METIIEYFKSNPALTLGIIIFLLFIIMMIFKNIKYLLFAAVIGGIAYYLVYSGYIKKDTLKNIKLDSVKEKLNSAKEKTKEKIVEKLKEEY